MYQHIQNSFSKKSMQKGMTSIGLSLITLFLAIALYFQSQTYRYKDEKDRYQTKRSSKIYGLSIAATVAAYCSVLFCFIRQIYVLN